jgi:ribosomal protein S3
MDKNVIELAQQIGQFYLQKNNGDYEKTADEISKLQISEVIPIGITMAVIKVSKVGLMIGKRGEDIKNLEAFLKRRLFLIEHQTIQDIIIPYKEEYDFPYDKEI